MAADTATHVRRAQAIGAAMRLDRSRKLIVAAIGDRTVTTARLVAVTGLSKTTVRRHLNALIAMGALVQGVHPHDSHVPVYTPVRGGAT